MNKGFTALISVLIIACVMLSALATSSEILFLIQEKNVRELDMLQSRALAESCLDYAFLRLVQDSSFRISSAYVLPLAQGSCTIENIIAESDSYTITTSARVGTSVAAITSTLDLSDKHNPRVVTFDFS